MSFAFCIPHTRGGDPMVGSAGGGQAQVFPTHVGVIPISTRRLKIDLGIPHTRGGDPEYKLDVDAKTAYSPHTWG